MTDALSFRGSTEAAKGAAETAVYPLGTRIELGYLCNDEPGMPEGLHGTVAGMDDQPSLLMGWDNGCQRRV